MRFKIQVEFVNGWTQYSLSDSVYGTSAAVIPEAGGILNSFRIKIKRELEFIELIDGYKSREEWRNSVTTFYKSAKLSPFVCRISNARYSWQDKNYSFEKFVSNGNALHGLLFDTQYRVADQIVTEDFAEIHLIAEYRAIDPGYPFSYDLLIRYRLAKEGLFSVFTAIHNRSEESIPVADGWHPYFRFPNPVDKLQLTIKSSKKFEYNSNLVPTGATIEDRRWEVGALIGTACLDNCYILDISDLQPLCKLTDPDSGISVEIMPSHSYPFLQVYIPEYRNSIAIEAISAPPDVFNNRINLLTLAPRRTATFLVEYRVSTSTDF